METQKRKSLDELQVDMNRLETSVAVAQTIRCLEAAQVSLDHLEACARNMDRDQLIALQQAISEKKTFIPNALAVVRQEIQERIAYFSQVYHAISDD